MHDIVRNINFIKVHRVKDEEGVGEREGSPNFGYCNVFDADMYALITMHKYKAQSCSYNRYKSCEYYAMYQDIIISQ